jgi:stage II sporulation protein M
MDNYSLSWKFIKESRNYFFIVSAIFLVFVVIGFFFPIFFIDYINQFIKQIVAQTNGMNSIQLFIFILQNNVSAAFLGLVLGFFLGVMPIFYAAFNGYLIGFVANKVVAVSGGLVLLKLFPHGIFEIPALILSLGLGLRFGMFIFRKKGKRKKDFLYSLENSLRVFLYVIIPLLLIAAIIETGLIILFG